MRRVQLLAIILFCFTSWAEAQHYEDVSEAFLYKESAKSLTVDKEVTMTPLVWNKILAMEQLESLTLQTNRIQHVPDDILNMESLRKLYIQAGSIESWGAGLAELQSLEELELSYCYKGEIPDFVYYLPNLKVLKLNLRKATQLGDISHMSNLEVLHLHLPDMIDKPLLLTPYTELRELDLDLPSLSEFPAEISQLKKLRKLFLRLPSVTNMKSIDSLAHSIDTLHLSLLTLSSWPAALKTIDSLSVFKLLIKNSKALSVDLADLSHAEKLIFQGVKFDKWESSNSRLTRLKELRFYSCKFKKDEPKWIYGLSLTYLGLHRNENLDYGFLGSKVQVRELVIQDNKLKAIPKNLHKVDSLQHLDISSHALTDFGKLGKASQLRSLSIGRNHELTSIDPVIFNLVQLEEFHLDARNLKELPEEISQLQRLTKLTLKSRNWKQLPVALAQLKALRFLTLAYIDRPSLLDGLFKETRSLQFVAVYVPKTFEEARDAKIRKHFSAPTIIIKRASF